MVSLVGGGAAGPRTGAREVRPPGALIGLGCGGGMLDAIGVPIVGAEALCEPVGLCDPVEPTGTVLIVPGSSLREVLG